MPRPGALLPLVVVAESEFASRGRCFDVVLWGVTGRGPLPRLVLHHPEEPFVRLSPGLRLAECRVSQVNGRS